MSSDLDSLRVRIFGQPWDAPICEDAPHVPTPVGSRCMWCDELIVEGDNGVVTAVIGLGHHIHHAPTHRDCWIRQAVGSVGHQLGMCSCDGGVGTFHDPPGTTRRHAAELAVRLSHVLLR